MNVPEPKLDTRKERERRGERDRERPETHSYRIVICIHKTQKDRHRRHARKLNWPPSSATRLSLSLSHALLRLATTSTKEGDTTESRSLHHQQYLETYPAVRVCSLSSPTPLSPHTAMPRIQKKSICAHTRRHCIAIGILHPPPAHAATSKGNEEGHTKRAVHSKALQRPPFPHRGPHTPPAAPACIPPLCARLRRGTLPAQASARRAGRADPRRSAPLAQRTATGTSTCCRAPGGRATTGVYTCRVTARTCRSSP